LVALDLDGTTLNTSHDLNQVTIDAIQAVAARGVRVVLASGRLPHSIRPFAQRLGLDGVHLGLNGGVAFDSTGRLLHKHLLSLDQLAFAHEVLAEEGLAPMVFSPAGIWAPRITDDVHLVLSYGEPEALTYSQIEQIVDPVKVLAVLGAGDRDRVLTDRVEPRLHAIRTGPQFFEFMAPGVGKGPALTEVMEDLGIDRDEVMAIGDSENDVGMLEAAGFPVAMGNAVEVVKRASVVVTGTNAEDGVSQALRRFVLNFKGQ
jgi:Cof subfamily protein (haloacid dehalogenase superfamily)